MSVCQRFTHFVCASLIPLSLPSFAIAAVIPVPNGDFETFPVDPNADGDNDYSTGDISPPWNGDHLRRNTNEAFTRPSTFVLGWQSNGPADTDDGNPTDDGKFGLQQPRSGTGTNQLYYQRTEPAGTVPTGDLMGGFNGNLIGFVNMDDADGFDQEIQSGVIGSLMPGTYKLNVAVGARANQNWNDVAYEITLVANPTAGDLGTSGGTVLGTPASVTLEVLGTSPDTSNIHDLTYTLTIPPSDSNIGAPYAIRIAAHNAFTQNGAPDAGAPINGGTNARFTQGNFDNVRLEFIPEPAAGLLAAVGMGMVALKRRRRA